MDDEDGKYDDAGPEEADLLLWDDQIHVQGDRKECKFGEENALEQQHTEGEGGRDASEIEGGDASMYYDESGILIGNYPVNEVGFSRAMTADHLSHEIGTHLGTEMDTEFGQENMILDVDDMDNHFDAETDDTRNYISEYEIEPTDEPLSTDKKLERLGLNRTNSGADNGDDGDDGGSDRRSTSSSESDSDYGKVEIMYYNPHLMSDVLLSDTESRMLNFADLKYAEYIHKRQSTTIDNLEPLVPLTREYSSEEFNVFVNHPENILMDSFEYSLNSVNKNDSEAIREEMATQQHLEQLYIASGLAGHFHRRSVAQGKELGGRGGLSSAEAEEKLYYLEDGRPNEFERLPAHGIWVDVTQDLFRQKIGISVITIGMLLAFQESLAFLYASALIFFVLSVRLYNEKHIQFDDVLGTLERHVSIVATVKRDDVWSIIDASQLVPGDLILLEGPGTIVPADCRINPVITSYNLDQTENCNFEIRLDQSVLSGCLPSVVSAYPGDSVKMLSKVVVGENILCTVEFTAYNTYLGKIIQVVRRSCTLLQMATSGGTKYDNMVGRVATILLVIIAIIGTGVCIFNGASLAVSVSSHYEIGVTKVIMLCFVLGTMVLSLSLLCLLVLIVGANEFKTNYRVAIHRLSSIIDLATMNVLCIDSAMVSNTSMANRLNGIGGVSVSDPLYRCQLESNFEEEEPDPVYDEDGNVVEVEPHPPNADDVCAIYIEDCDISELFLLAILATKWPDIFHDPSLFDSPDIQLNHDDFYQYIVNNNHFNPNFESTAQDDGRIDFPVVDSIDFSLLTAVSDWPGILTAYQQIHYDISTFSPHSPDLMCVNNDIFNSNSTGCNPHCIQSMSTLHHRTSGEAFRVIKGAPHIILQMVLNTNKTIGSDDNQDYDDAFVLQFEKDVVRFVMQGFRVMAVAKSLLRPAKVRRHDLDKTEKGPGSDGGANGDNSDDDSVTANKRLTRKRSGKKKKRLHRKGKRADDIYIDHDGNLIQKDAVEEEDSDSDSDESDDSWESDGDNESIWGAGTDGSEGNSIDSDEEEELELCWKMVGLLTFASAESHDMEEVNIRAAAVKDFVVDLNKNCGLSIKVLSSESWWVMKNLLCSCKPGEEELGVHSTALGIADLIQSPYTVELPSLDAAKDNELPADLKKTHQHCISGSDAFAEIYPQHKYLIAECLMKCGYDVGFFGQVPTDAAAMVTSTVSLALAGEDGNEPRTMLQSVADIVLPAKCVATERSEITGEHTMCTASGVLLLPKCVLLARTVLQRVIVIIQYKIANILFLLFIQVLVIVLLSNREILQNSVEVTHGNVSDSGVVIIPLAVMIVSMLMADILGFYAVTNANYTNSSNNDRFYDDYEFSLLSQRNDHVHVTATNTAELDNYEREHDPLLQATQRNNSRANRQTSSSISDNMSIGASRFPENLRYIVFNRMIIGVVMALVCASMSGLFIYFLTVSMEVDGVGKDAVELNLDKNPGEARLHGFLWSVHSLLQHNGHLSAVITVHLFLAQCGMYLSVHNGKEWAWKRAGWWLISSDEVVNNNMINIATSEWVLMLLYYFLVPGVLGRIGNGLDYAQTNTAHTAQKDFLDSFGTLFLNNIASVLLICIYTGMQFLVCETTKMWIIYQLRKHSEWSKLCSNNVVRFSDQTIAWLAEVRERNLNAENTYINNTEPPLQEDDDEGWDEWHEYESKKQKDIDETAAAAEFGYGVHLDEFGNEVDEYGNVVYKNGEYDDYVDDEKEEEGTAEYDSDGNLIEYEEDEEGVEYDSDGNLIEYEKDEEGAEYDSDGNLIEYEKEEEGAEYDSDGNLIEYEEDEEGAEYDSDGNLIEYEKEEEGAEYDSDDNLIEYEKEEEGADYRRLRNPLLAQSNMYSIAEGEGEEEAEGGDADAGENNSS